MLIPKMKKYLLSLAFLAASAPAFAGGAASLWRQTDGLSAKPRIQAETYLSYRLRFADMVAVLKDAPLESQGSVALDLPLPDGSVKTFRVWETPLSTGAFYEKYPDLRTYTGTQQDKPGVTVKIDVGAGFFHALILDGGEQYFIDPHSLASDDNYIVYDRKNMSLAGREMMRCEMEQTAIGASPAGDTPAEMIAYGTIRRTYRLALACTGEYAVAATGLANPTKAQVLAKMITSVNRVNGIYEREIAARLQLIPNTDTLIFLNGATDPYTNNNGGAMLGQNQSTVTARIGSANYDIGHVFSTGGGGIAALGSLCSSFSKARGVTGSPNPVGDPFDVDYVAHEMGHQFGGDHTFNANTGSCSGNAELLSAFEPGSGSTIMAYAGICGRTNDLQSRTDAYFHFRSLDQTTTQMASTPTCGVSVNTGNTAPVITQQPAFYTIPWLTPFELTADPVSGTAVTYCWEQNDLGNFETSYSDTSTNGPIWRSQMPTPERTRVFPTLARLLANQFGGLGDRPVAVGRVMSFRLTARDVGNGTGSFAISNASVASVRTIKAADTFRITNLLTVLDTLTGGGNKTITWNVSNTTAAPINCSTVDIYYSTDSGQTWPYLLASSVPNNGAATVRIPNIATSKGRIKIKASNNIFFIINYALLRTYFDPAAVNSISGAEKQVKIYPVPAKDVVKLEIPENISSVDAVLYNNMGQQLWKGRFDGGLNSFPVQNYPTGNYYFRLQNTAKGFAETASFVVQ